MSSKTTLVRMNKKLRDELRQNYPDVDMPQLLNTMYRTSALRFETFLRNDKPKKNK